MKHQISATIEYTVAGSPSLYNIVRAGFVAQGTTLNSWCIAQGINRQTAEKALRGDRHGPKSRAVLEQLLAAALPGTAGRV